MLFYNFLFLVFHIEWMWNASTHTSSSSTFTQQTLTQVKFMFLAFAAPLSKTFTPPKTEFAQFVSRRVGQSPQLLPNFSNKFENNFNTSKIDVNTTLLDLFSPLGTSYFVEALQINPHHQNNKACIRQLKRRPYYKQYRRVLFFLLQSQLTAFQLTPR